MKRVLALTLATILLAQPGPAIGLSRPPTVIYFSSGSTIPERDHAIRNVWRTLWGRPFPYDSPVTYIIAGHTDRAGSRDINFTLSCARAEAIRDMLISKGISPELIVVQAFGETRPAVETEDGETEPLNRRVEITYGPADFRPRRQLSCGR